MTALGGLLMIVGGGIWMTEARHHVHSPKRLLLGMGFSLIGVGLVAING